MFWLTKHLTTVVAEEAFLQKILTGFFVGIVVSVLVLTFGCSNRATKETPESTSATEKHSSPMESSKVFGIDVSHFQGDIDWKETQEMGVAFAYTKATQGDEYTDPKFDTNWKALRNTGIYRGAYHFYMAGKDPEKQADHFIMTVGQLEKGDMPPMLDLEEGGISMAKDIDIDTYQKNVLKWLKRVEQALDIKPIIYTDHPFGSKYLTSPDFASYGLWIADWENRKSPLLPAVWNNNWLIWQRTERGTEEGIQGDVDKDLFNGSFKDLKSLTK